MKIIHAADELKSARRKVCVAIGFFDGVHLGHQQIIRQTVADARQHDALALVLTFDRHPDTVVAPDRVPQLIYSLPQKLRAVESLGADAVLLMHFDEKFSRQSGEEFVRALARGLCAGEQLREQQHANGKNFAPGRGLIAPGCIYSVCVGVDFVFGRKRSGDVLLLKRLGTEMGFTVHGIAAVSLDGKIVSSTRIRELIRNGDLDAVRQMLGRPYAISGRVIEGNRLGRQLGFPTANLDVAGLMLPPNGVYAALTNIKGKTYRAALNIGFRPTILSQTQAVHVEAHLINFEGDIYGDELEIEIGDKLRAEKKFKSKSELREQIIQDIASIKSDTN